MRLSVILIGILLTLPATAQDHEHEAMHEAHHGPMEARAEVRAVIDRLLDGIRAGDSTVVRSVFASEARLITTFTADGRPARRLTPADAFVAAVGSPHDVVWDERIWDVRIDVRDNLASAWMDYAFFAGEAFAHCGVNAFQLARDESGAWMIIHVADTRRSPDSCELPDDVRG